MATHADVRRIALALSGTTESPDDFRFFVESKAYIWLWQERVDPKKARVPNPDVIVVAVADDIAKQVLLAMDRDVFFTEPHYDGYNAVHVRLKMVSLAVLRKVITEAWQTRVAKRSGSRSPRRRPASAARPARRPRRRRA